MKPSFQIQQKSIGPFPLIEVRHPDGRSFSVLPSVGAAIHQIELTAEGKAHKLLVPMRTAVEIERNRWAKSAHLIPFPNRIHRGRYSFDGTAHQLPINFRPNGGHAIHGFLMSRTWDVLEQELTPSRAMLALNCSAKDGHPGFPFPYEAKLTLSLDEQGFQMETRIRNLGPATMPAGWGWHPYFRTGSKIDGLELQLPSDRKLTVDEWMIPTGGHEKFPGFKTPSPIGDRFLDACLELPSSATPHESHLLDRSLGLKLTVWQDGSVSRYLQVFTHPHRHGIALEPMSCAPDAFNNQLGFQTIQPGKELVTNCGVRLSSL
jgi:aldose 1-epimerase